MSKKLLRLSLTVATMLTLMVALLPASVAVAADNEVTITALYRQDVPVTFDGASSAEISSLDPQIPTDVISIAAIENLFLGLTTVDPITNAIEAELATSWEVSADGLTWTFNLRNDANWMQYDPSSDTAAVVRPVVAGDVVYGIKRACDPRLGSYYGSVAATVIAGCDLVNQSPSESVTDEFVFGDTTKISAPDDVTVIIELQFSAGYFFSMTPMWMLKAVPREIIEEYGDDWTQPGNIVTNGPYFLKENTRGVRRVFVRNDTLPVDLYAGTGNIEIQNVTLIEDTGTQYALYLDKQLDTVSVPRAEIQNALADSELSQQILQIFDLAVGYYGFAHDKAPFDNVHARRAFSTIVNREAFVEQIAGGRGVPMIHFTPPGMFGAPAINAVGIGYDPEYAVVEMEAAGYPNCEGFPSIDVVTQQGAGTWAEFWAAAAEEHLGCDPALFNIEQLEFSVYLQVTDEDTAEQDRPHAWMALWGPDYPDANNWVGDVLSCEVKFGFKRPCTEVDDLISQAAAEGDPIVREQLYAEIEEAFFGVDGEFPIAPIYLRSGFILVQPYYTGPFETDGLFGGAHWDTRTIDMAAKLAAQGK